MASLNEIIGLAIGLFVAGVMLPVGLSAIGNATLVGVDPLVTTMFKILLPMLAVIALALMFIPRLKRD